MNSVQDAVKTSKQLAQNMAKQAVQEPWEILQSAGRQVAPIEQAIKSGIIPHQTVNETPLPPGESQIYGQDKIRSQRMVEGLERELEDIRRQKIFNELQKKISNGEEVYLTDFVELDHEQKAVLTAQIEAIAAQKKVAAGENKLPAEPGSKQGRRFLGIGPKSQALREQTKTERPLPPSG